MTNKGHYPTYDILNEKQHWDEHTREIVEKRLTRPSAYRNLTLQEAELLRAWCSQLMDDNRAEVINYVIDHIDGKLTPNQGEGQRKPNIPPSRTLIKRGLEEINQLALSLHKRHFYQLEADVQRNLMTDISLARGQEGDERMHVQPEEFFRKLLLLTIEAFYSHPEIWSEIGFGGPAYPRGYVRLGIGQLDSWEAKGEQ
ncbi:gluconate 2-dehydrogenase subunit 3 family protein [Paenibacillus albiflavus]|uniref:Gluconate 2-dehydrogenase subunit 3 family protein n=1 Tax=Paenibacillus albiflavus TaxID=2545760 RepID=A0A4R4E0D3_9BACL|nr:gluconate 2-dehydrogenase subunit 3 family protein [Paenibacillus albiflavus]TCZ72864.1 gluconate 2-dehydrogenase subunit 3 family protein [Paenibacillus albiflavus]